MPVPIDSPQMEMLKRMRDILEADPTLSSYFGWELAPVDPDDDWEGRKRIFLDDSGSCSPEHSPKLILTEFIHDESFSILGEGGEVPSDITAQIAVVIYVYVDKGQAGEEQKVLAGNLHAAVRKVIRKNVVDDDNPDGIPLWSNLSFEGPACSFDQSDGFRRAGGVVSLYRQERITD